MKSEDKELLDFYGEQLEIIREINIEIGKNNSELFCENKKFRRENGFLICLVIAMSIWIATFYWSDL